MKRKVYSVRAGFIVLACLSASRLEAQVILNPSYINGTIQFTNTCPATLSILLVPGNLGMTEGTLYAYNLLPPFRNTPTSPLQPSASAHLTKSPSTPAGPVLPMPLRPHEHCLSAWGASINNIYN